MPRWFPGVLFGLIASDTVCCSVLAPKTTNCYIGEHAPAALVAACHLFWPELRSDLQEFFSGTNPPFTFHMADLIHDSAKDGFNSDRCALLARKYLAGEKIQQLAVGRGRVPGGYREKFAAEALLPLLMNRSRYINPDVTKADLVMIAYCSSSKGRGGVGIVPVPELIASQPSDIVKRFKSSGGSDFALVASNDHGPCRNFREGWRNTKSTRKGGARWHTNAIKEMVLLTNEGSTINGCFRPGHHLTIPTSAVTAQPKSPCADTTSAKRKSLIFFAGKDSSAIRQMVADGLKDDPDAYHSHGRMNQSQYACAMSEAVFCLAPRGLAAWSPRFDEALHAGCIPVLIADNYEPPFSRVLNYSSFSIRIPEHELHLPKIHHSNPIATAHAGKVVMRVIKAVSMSERERLLANGRAVRPFFRYRADSGTFGSEIVDLVLFQLWRRKMKLDCIEALPSGRCPRPND